MSTELPIEVSADDVSYLLTRPGPRTVRLIDCREEDEWRICRIEGAELVPLSRFGEEAPRRFQDAGEHIVIYCHHGMRSLKVAGWLRQHGFHQAQSMRGGVDAWADLVEPDMPRY